MLNVISRETVESWFHVSTNIFSFALETIQKFIFLFPHFSSSFFLHFLLHYCCASRSMYYVSNYVLYVLAIFLAFLILTHCYFPDEGETKRLSHVIANGEGRTTIHLHNFFQWNKFSRRDPLRVNMYILTCHLPFNFSYYFFFSVQL